MSWLIIAILVVFFDPLVHCKPTRDDDLKSAEQLTDCGRGWELRTGPDKDLTLAAEFAAHVAFQELNLERKDVLLRVIGGYLMDCQYPKYRIAADFISSNCTRRENHIYGIDECVGMPGSPIRHCKIYMFVQKYGSARLVKYSCEDEPLTPNWKPKEFSDDDFDLEAKKLRNQYNKNSHYNNGMHLATQNHYRFEDHPGAMPTGGIGPWFLLFCALLPIAGLVILYRVW